LDELNALATRPDGADFTRPNLIALLNILTSHLGTALETKAKELDEGVYFAEEHPVAAQLSGLASSLRDLDCGLTDPVLKAAKSDTNASLGWRQRQEDEDLFEAVEIFQRIEKIPNLKAAARRVAVKLQFAKYERRGKSLKASTLYALYNKYR
jgi:hypothetical protein